MQQQGRVGQGIGSCFILLKKQNRGSPSLASHPSCLPSSPPLPLRSFLFFQGVAKRQLYLSNPLHSSPTLPQEWRGLEGLERVGWKKNSSTSPTPSLGWERVGWKVGREECGDNIRSHSLFNKLVMLNLILHSTYIYILLRNVLFLKKLQYVINPVTKKGCI